MSETENTQVVHNGEVFAVTLRRVRIGPLPRYLTRAEFPEAMAAAGWKGSYRNFRRQPKGDTAELTFDTDKQAADFLARYRADGLVLPHRRGDIVIRTATELDPDTVAAHLKRRENRRATRTVKNPFAAAGLEPDGPPGAAWANIPYAEQLGAKERAVRGEFSKALKKFRKLLTQQGNPVPEWISGPLAYPLFAGLRCRPSPETEHYRNSANFTIGRGADDAIIAGAWAPSGAGVEPVRATISPRLALELATATGEFLTEAGAEPYDRRGHNGGWRALRVREPTLAVDAPVIIAYETRSEVPAADVAAICRAMRPRVAAVGRTAIFLHLVWDGVADWSQSASGAELYHILLAEDEADHAFEAKPVQTGDEGATTFERLCGLKFRISLTSFFQVNSKAAEQLYTSVAEAALAPRPPMVLDVCCGTGTIGCITAAAAERAECPVKVAGVDIVESAVDDARANAAANGLADRTSWVAGDARKVLPLLCGQLPEQGGCVAVVDPPRAGLHKAVVEALRKTERITRVVYVSCNPASLGDNLIDFFHPANARRSGAPFAPVAAWAVDQFPHTNHVEAVVVLERTADEHGGLTPSLAATAETLRGPWEQARAEAEARWAESARRREEAEAAARAAQNTSETTAEQNAGSEAQAGAARASPDEK